VTTHLIVRTAFLEEHPEVVERLLRGHVEAVDFVSEQPEEARRVTNEGIAAITGKPLGEAVIGGGMVEPGVHRRPDRQLAAEGTPRCRGGGLAGARRARPLYELAPLNAVLGQLDRSTVEGLR
jgi:NitT/TauT family transport system substrate-binding protein